MIFDFWYCKIFDDDFFGIVGCFGDIFYFFVWVVVGEMVIDIFGILLIVMDQFFQFDYGGRDWDFFVNVFCCVVVLVVFIKVEDDRFVVRIFLIVMIK